MSLTNMGKKKEIKKMMTHLAPRTSHLKKAGTYLSVDAGRYESSGDS